MTAIVGYLDLIWKRASTEECYLKVSGEDIVQNERISLNYPGGIAVDDSILRHGKLAANGRIPQLKYRRIGL